MKWLDRLLGRPPHVAERKAERKALEELHRSADRVKGRTSRLERELSRVNGELRRQVHR